MDYSNCNPAFQLATVEGLREIKSHERSTYVSFAVHNIEAPLGRGKNLSVPQPFIPGLNILYSVNFKFKSNNFPVRYPRNVC